MNKTKFNFVLDLISMLIVLGVFIMFLYHVICLNANFGLIFEISYSLILAFMTTVHIIYVIKQYKHLKQNGFTEDIKIGDNRG